MRDEKTILRVVAEIREPNAPARWTVMPVPAVIGRGERADVRLSDPAVSTAHATLRASEGAVVLTDAGSANGVLVVGVRVPEVTLGRGTTLAIGSSTVRVLAVVEESSRVVRIRRVSEPAARRVVVRLPALVGHGAGATVSIEDAALHPTHAVVLPSHDGVEVIDLGASEPTLHPEGAPVRFGDHVLEFETQWEPAAFATDLVFAADGSPVLTTALPQPSESFPPRCFDAPEVSVADLLASRLPLFESRFLALGGGLGSFCWVDALRIHGVPADAVRVVGFERVPYARYQRLCRNSQIPSHERLRSNSESCPDNLWGFPGYGLREAASALGQGQILDAVQVLRQLYGEPDLAATYTPRAGAVFRSIDREAARIGWSDMLLPGRIRAVRKTDDGRYAVAVSSLGPEVPGGYAVCIAPVVHLALGYPGVQFLPDLRAYRTRTQDFAHVVNAYEDHDHVYAELERRGGRVALRGRGIVASRILQRLYEARARNPAIEVVHLMRKPLTAGSVAGLARRHVENHWEFQPFNWPEACWGGDLAEVLQRADPAVRQELLAQWGGTTTAPRSDWRRIVRDGLREGWYRIVFGAVQGVDRDDSIRLVVVGEQTEEVAVDYVIDATGLVSRIEFDPVLSDLSATYGLERNVQGRLDVDSSFEIRGLRNGGGRVFAAGVATLGSGYAPVDSFLGLQRATAASIEALAPAVPPLGVWRSMQQWTRWAVGGAP